MKGKDKSGWFKSGIFYSNKDISKMTDEERKELFSIKLKDGCLWDETVLRTIIKKK